MHCIQSVHCLRHCEYGVTAHQVRLPTLRTAADAELIALRQGVRDGGNYWVHGWSSVAAPPSSPCPPSICPAARRADSSQRALPLRCNGQDPGHGGGRAP